MLTSQHAAKSAQQLIAAQQSHHLEPLTNRTIDAEKQRWGYNLLLFKCRVEWIEQDRIFHFWKRNKTALSTEFEVNEEKLVVATEWWREEPLNKGGGFVQLDFNLWHNMDILEVFFINKLRQRKCSYQLLCQLLCSGLWRQLEYTCHINCTIL